MALVELDSFLPVLREAFNLDRFDVDVDRELRFPSVIICVTCRGCQVSYNVSYPMDDLRRDLRRDVRELLDHIAHTATRALSIDCTCWSVVRERRQTIDWGIDWGRSQDSPSPGPLFEDDFEESSCSSLISSSPIVLPKEKKIVTIPESDPIRVIR
jgi:hypothetical protein